MNSIITNKGGNCQEVQSVCKMCLAGCNIIVKIKDGVVIKIEGDPSSPDNLGKICAKGQAGLMRLYDPNRVKTPLLRTNPEKGAGVDPHWVEISWEEAFELVSKKLKAIRDEDPRKLLTAFSDFQSPPNGVWPAAFGTKNRFTTVGQYCGAAYHPINGMLDGSFARVNDYDYCNYWLQIGGGDGFSSHLHMAGSIKRMADARAERNMKVVYVEPRLSAGAAKAEEWIPIRPGTDRAFAMGMMHAMVLEYGIYDQEFLTVRTNAPYLVDNKGLFLRDPKSGLPYIWDQTAKQTREYNDPKIIDFALIGTYEVSGVTCKPAFQVFLDILEEHPPEKMSNICGVPADTIRRIGKEFGTAAQIGSNIIINGEKYPYRPAALNFYRGAISHYDGGLDCLAMIMPNILIGNIDVPGGSLGVAFDWRGLWIQEGKDGMLMPEPHMLHPAYDFQFPTNSLHMAELFPLGVDPAHLGLDNFLDPERFGIDFQPEALILYHANPMWSSPGTEKMQEVFRRLKFIVAIDILENETTEWADVILPDHTYLESNMLICLEPPFTTQHSYRKPVIEPLYNTKSAHEILTELAVRIGFLDSWNDLQSFRLELYRHSEYILQPDQRYNLEEVLDRFAKATYGSDYGIDWFAENGHNLRTLTNKEKYLPYQGIRIPFYFNYIIETGLKLNEQCGNHGLDWDISSYLPLPRWRQQHPLHNLPPEYDLYAITYKTAPLNFAESTTLPWIKEIIEREGKYLGVLINSKTAEIKNIQNDDRVVLESPFGEMEAIVKVTEEVHPEVIAFSNGITRWTRHPVERRLKMHFNKLLPANIEFTDMMTGAFETAVKVKIRKAEQ